MADVPDIEQQARRQNEADRALSKGMAVYFADGYTWEEFVERVAELALTDDYEFPGMEG